MVMVMLVLFGKLTSHKSMGVVVVFEQMYWLFFLLSQVDEHGHGHDGIVRQMYSLFTTQWAWSWSLWSCLANVLNFHKSMGMVMVIVVLFGKCIDFSEVNGNGHGHRGIVRQMYWLFTSQLKDVSQLNGHRHGHSHCGIVWESYWLFVAQWRTLLHAHWS